MGRRIEAIKRAQEQSPEQVMASFLYYYVLNSKDHFWKTKYYDRTAYFELNNDNNAYFIDGSHLNAAGANEFTKDLIHILKNKIF